MAFFSRVLACTLAATALAGVARAETAPAPVLAMTLPSATPASQTATVAPMSRPMNLSPTSASPTAIDHSFGPSKDVTGSLGYLCGLEPTPADNRGAGSSLGPVGTFLGAKLSLAFK